MHFATRLPTAVCEDRQVYLQRAASDYIASQLPRLADRRARIRGVDRAGKLRAQRYGRCGAYQRHAQQLVSKPVRGEEDTCIGLRETKSVSVENGSGIAVRNRADLTRERTGTCLDVISNVNCGLDEQFVCIRPVCDAICVLRFVNFIAVLWLELELTHRRASWDWTRNTSWNECIAVLS